MTLASFLAAAILTLPVDSSAAAVPDSLPLPPAAASAPAAPDSGRILRLRDVIVTATRTPLALAAAPASVSVIVPDPLAPGNSAVSSISRIAGASFGATGGQGSATSVFLRGASNENVLVLSDGMPLNSPLLGGYDLNKIPGDADRIEIVRGPVSSLYGANAVGGVINITTAPAAGDRPYSRITYLKGSFGTQQLAAKFSRQLATKLSMWLGADWNSTGGQRVNSSYDGTNYSVGAATGPFWGVTAAARFQDYAAEAGVPGQLSSETPDATQRDKQQDVSLRLSRPADSGTCLAGGSLAVSHSGVRNTYANSGIESKNDSRLTSIDGQYSFNLPAAVLLTAGGAYQRAQCQSDNTGDRGVRQRALFANAQCQPAGGLLIVTGVRYDRNYSFAAQYSPAVSASYRLALPRGWSLTPYASWGRAFRAPTIDDLFWPVQAYPAIPDWGLFDASKFSGNPDIAPEASSQTELGLRTSVASCHAQVAVYQRRTTDLIDWTNTVRIESADTAMPDTLYTYPVNRGRVVSSGCELSVTYAPSSWLSLNANYTYSLSARDTIGKPSLPYRPRNVANGSLSINDLPLAEHLRLGWILAARYTDCQDPGPYVAQMLPRTVVCDQTLSIKIRDARIFWRADNLFNANYQTRYGYPMPRRSHAFGVSIELWD